jgi:hypothetical protein
MTTALSDDSGPKMLSTLEWVGRRFAESAPTGDNLITPDGIIVHIAESTISKSIDRPEVSIS